MTKNYSKIEAMMSENQNTSQSNDNADNNDNNSPIENTIHIHNWDNETVVCKETCESDGKIIYRCSCGETREEIISATGHDYKEHICKTCGKINPNNQIFCKNIGAEGSTVMCYGYENEEDNTLYDIFKLSFIKELQL